MVRGKRIHTKKFQRCVKAVGKQSKIRNPYAICTSALGEKSFLKRPVRQNNPDFVQPVPEIPVRGAISFILSKDGKKLSMWNSIR